MRHNICTYQYSCRWILYVSFRVWFYLFCGNSYSFIRSFPSLTQHLHLIPVYANIFESFSRNPGSRVRNYQKPYQHIFERVTWFTFPTPAGGNSPSSFAVNQHPLFVPMRPYAPRAPHVVRRSGNGINVKHHHIPSHIHYFDLKAKKPNIKTKNLIYVYHE